MISYNIAYHPGLAPYSILLVPGIRGSIDGYKHKYVTIAEMIVSRGIGEVIRTDNPAWGKTPSDYAHYITTKLLKLADFVAHSRGYSLYGMGVSAGAGALAAVSAKAHFSKLLLISPASNVGGKLIQAGLKEYQGELYITAGKDDAVVDPLYGEQLLEWARVARRKEFRLIPDCGHNWEGERNGRLLSKAVLWAFAGDDTFPESLEGSIKLYD